MGTNVTWREAEAEASLVRFQNEENDGRLPSFGGDDTSSILRLQYV